MLQSIRAFAQTTTYLGVVMIVAIWGGIVLITNDAHDRAYEDGVRQGSNLTRLFEEYIWRVIREADSQLLVLRKLYEQDPVNLDFARWIDNEKLPGDLTVHFSITGSDGVIRLSTLGPIQSRVDVSHMESFSVHTLSTSDDLYISPPSTGHMSGKTSIQLTRRLVRPDGSFGGVIGGSLNVLQLEDFYNSIDVGPAGVIALVGFDGIIRARSGRNAAASTFIGQSVADTKVFGLFRKTPTGAYWNSASSANLEGISRLVSYRVVEGLPLIAIVGMAETDIFQQSTLTAHRYGLIGLFLTVVVLFANTKNLRRKLKLAAAKASLEQTNSLFDAALQNMTHGLCMF